MRRLSLNLLTGSATLLLLGALALPAKRVLDAPSRADRAAAVTPKRVFGVYVDPWHVDDWARDVGAAPQMVAKFEAFSNQRTIDDFIHETEKQGIGRLLVSWEPWKPVPTSRGLVAQLRPQLGYRNADIADGSQDRYIGSFAKSLATFDGIVYLRYAHEMNGAWYPWSHDWNSYRRAWRHVVTLFRREGVHNVRFVWSANLNLYLPKKAWLQGMRKYWPGSRYVDVVGATMINFGGRKNYTVKRFVPRFRTFHKLYGKPIMITEANTNYRNRVPWLRNLRHMLGTMPWIRWIAWSQLPSRAQAHLRSVGNLNWDVQHDPPAATVLRMIIRDGVKKR